MAPEINANPRKTNIRALQVVVALLAAVAVCGCASTEKAAETSDGIKFRRTDKLDKVWIADGFNFVGYDTLLMTPVTTTVTPKNDRERERLEMARHTLTRDFGSALEFKQIVPSFAGKDADVKPGSRALKLENQITEFSAGSTAARVMVGMGAGTPKLRVRGQVIDVASGQPVVIYELDETAPIFGAAWASSRSLQSAAVSELAEDVADFLWQIAKGHPIKHR